MRAVITLCVLLLLAAAPAAGQPAAPSADAEALRRELEQMRQQFDRVQGEYRKAMEAMSERLQRLEARPQSAATQPISPALVQAPAGPAPSQPTLMDIVRPRPPFSLAERTGRGQLLFDIGVVGDFIGNITGNNVDLANAGTFAGRENRIFPREIELLFFGQIDPFARGEVRIEAAEEFNAATSERTTAVNLAEANLTLLTLPWGFQAKMGKMRNRFGLLNERHREALPQPDQPNVLTNFIGEEGLNESGLEVTWVPPLPVYFELLGGVFNGDNEDAFGRGSLRHPLITGRARTFFELGSLGAVQVGGSVASGQTAQLRHNDNTLWGIEAKYKLTPDGWRHPLLTLGSEALWGSRKTTVDLDGDDVPDVVRRTGDRFGWYVYGEVQPWRQWLGGLRYDWSQYPVNAGDEWAIEPYLAFMPSDFLRFRLGYKHTERDRNEFFQANGGNGRVGNEIFLQATFFLGAHAAHPF